MEGDIFTVPEKGYLSPEEKQNIPLRRKWYFTQYCLYIYAHSPWVYQSISDLFFIFNTRNQVSYYCEENDSNSTMTWYTMGSISQYWFGFFGARWIDPKPVVMHNFTSIFHLGRGGGKWKKKKTVQNKQQTKQTQFPLFCNIITHMLTITTTDMLKKHTHPTQWYNNVTQWYNNVTDILPSDIIMWPTSHPVI